ncbi:TPA: hypothetical protein DD449_04680 [Candidatus Berkelbacteria bacterium]|uniref:Flavodoxin-like domain-containing protein n=1 Tax=Berkelbacteria bacterium GW2011_GWE1_39_12 TaxID=1618337 RepID=A0A0G4B451_9BACT|nr:MAG: hypothetical protein UT28_C0001G0556 [Berkelbacteria bacterium GW2011_GWE1_39_12]HBO60950.1 hypothetical protein [Candidatus Berkelbacteria bacterium]
MKTLVVYYSRSGHNESLARNIAKKLNNSEIEEIVDLKNREGGWGIFISILGQFSKKLTQIQTQINNPKDFDLVVIVSPLWAGILPSPTRTYIAKNNENLKKYAFISVSGSGKDNSKAIEDIEKTVHQSPSASLLLSESDYKGDASLQIEEFLNNLA